MQAVEIEALLRTGLDDCEVSVSGEGNHFDILVVGEVFADLRPVKKQQMVYAVLREQIADGSIHAVNIRTFTAAEWAQQQ
jgi:acid stress-induced BolA-like protein IbaG/YrbA